MLDLHGADSRQVEFDRLWLDGACKVRGEQHEGLLGGSDGGTSGVQAVVCLCECDEVALCVCKRCTGGGCECVV